MRSFFTVFVLSFSIVMGSQASMSFENGDISEESSQMDSSQTESTLDFETEGTTAGACYYLDCDRKTFERCRTYCSAQLCRLDTCSGTPRCACGSPCPNCE